MSNDYTNGKTFWKWYFSDAKNWLFGIFFNLGVVFIEYKIYQSDPAQNWIYAGPLAVAGILWFLTVRSYKQLKKGISK